MHKEICISQRKEEAGEGACNDAYRKIDFGENHSGMRSSLRSITNVANNVATYRICVVSNRYQ